MKPKTQTLLVLHSYAAGVLERARINIRPYDGPTTIGSRELSMSRDRLQAEFIEIQLARHPPTGLVQVWQKARFVFVVGDDKFARAVLRLCAQLSTHCVVLERPLHVLSFRRMGEILSYGLRIDPVNGGFNLMVPMSATAKHSPPSTATKQSVYRIWYATNRKVHRSGSPDLAFSGERGNTVSFGHCDVSIPKSHRIGSTGTAWWRRLLRLDFHDDHLRIRSLRNLAENAFWDALTESLQTWDTGERTCLAFIHGYNVSWSESVIRAAQLGFDLKIPLTAVFSWASRGSTTGYTPDEATIAASEWAIEHFLSQLVANSGVERLHLVAHSMGNRGTLRALERIANRTQAKARIPFGQIILASPDVDKMEFQNVAKAHHKLCERTTTYVSSRDKALKASEIFHGGYDRAGYAPPITIVDGIDTIDASHVSFSWLGHSEFAVARDVLKDIFTLVHHGTAPKRRQGISSRKTEDGAEYYAFDKVER